MKFEKLFVTVGTTEFDSLIEKLCSREICEILEKYLGCRKIKIQYGRGKTIDNDGELKNSQMKLSSFDLKSSISQDISEADLIISHAGAGTCIEVLNLGKPLIVVTNDKLMNNHQSELAVQLQEDGYLFCTSIDELAETLKTFDNEKLKKYEKGNLDKFIAYLDDFMGFV